MVTHLAQGGGPIAGQHATGQAAAPTALTASAYALSGSGCRPYAAVQATLTVVPGLGVDRSNGSGGDRVVGSSLQSSPSVLIRLESTRPNEYASTPCE